MISKENKKKPGAWLQSTLERMRPRKTRDVFATNEQQGNEAVALTILATEIIFIVTLLLNKLHIFEGRALTVAMIVGIITQLIPLIIYAAFGPGKSWMKDVLLLSMIISLGIIDAQLTYKTTLLMAVPVVISIRYFSKVTTLRVAVCTAVVFMLSAIWGAAYGILDVNIVDLPQNFTLYISNRLVRALEEMGLSESMLIRNALVLSFLPKLLLYTIIASASLYSTVRGHQMILEEQHNSRVDAELSMAREIQQNNLPVSAGAFPDRSEFEISAAMDPARETSGDFYDFFMIDEDHLCFLIADVSDKGVPAALFMMSSKILLNYRSKMGGSPGEILKAVNAQLSKDNVSKMFVTVWIGILDVNTGVLTCSNAGHEYPVIRGQDGVFRIFKDKHGIAAAAMPGAKYRDYELFLEPGDAIFVYTDGVTEANNPSGEMYGMKRLESALNRTAGLSPADILQTVRSDLDAFVDNANQFDDLTMLCLEYKGRR